MDLKTKITGLLKEGDSYKKMGLLSESKGKYQAAIDLISRNKGIGNAQTVIAGIQKKIEAVDNQLNKISKASETPELPPEIQNLIAKNFADSPLEGAIALAKFGQYNRAIQEFSTILADAEKSKDRMTAAKNIIRCHFSLNDWDNAVDQYESWLSGGSLSRDHLLSIKDFIETVLKKKKVKRTLSDPEEIIAEKAEAVFSDPLAGSLMPDYGEEEDEEDILDISSIGITIPNGPMKGQQIELDVSFQNGSMISLIIPSQQKELIESLSIGLKLMDVQFYSPIAIFQGAATVREKSKISSGPKEGDYSLDVKIENN